MNKFTKGVFIISVIIASSGCTNPDTATQALLDAGYSDIEITGYSFFGCSEDDTFKTGFIAKSARGKDVKGVVCSGFLKGSTIRTK
jgi:hypothetical protein